MSNYWKIKAVALETELRLAQLQKSAAEVVEKKRVAFEDAGLDPSTTYTFDDDAQTIESAPIEP